MARFGAGSTMGDERLLHTQPMETRPRISAIRVLIVLLWLWTACSQLGRIHLVFSYETIATLPPLLEPFGAPPLGLCVCILSAVGYLLLERYSIEKDRHRPFLNRGDLLLLVASAPSLLSLLRVVAPEWIPAMIWEPIWFCAGTAWAWSCQSRCCRLVAAIAMEQGEQGRLVKDRSVWWLEWEFIAIATLVVAVVWWAWQSEERYRSFMIGFNDGGHFAQRVANTASGHGFLLESPVLPPFWDHFNPGLLLFVPFWKAWPDVRLFFFAQPIALAFAGWLVYRIALCFGASRSVGALWCFAWILHPSVGQMNLAYTYGWHPIVFAIPFLLAAILLISDPFRRWHFRMGAILCTLVACSFEEGVIVVVGCFAAAMGLQAMIDRPAFPKIVGRQISDSLTALQWWSVWLFSVIGFLLVYRFSGLADFQSARFARLGDSTWEIIASPFLRPSEFFGLLTRPRNLPFLTIWFLPGLMSQGWRASWVWLAMAVPFSVLLVWEHLPAQSIAFQYTACLLPVLIMGSLIGSIQSKESGAAKSSAVAAAICSLMLSLFFGQLPWSQETLLDVQAKTYGTEDATLRQAGGIDSQWALEKIGDIRKAPGLRVLATGRVAMHFVGSRDVETVGQYWQRRADLARHYSDLQAPLLAYDVVFLDTLEEFQQSRENMLSLRQELAKWEFQVTDSEHGFEIYRPKKRH
jgi:uncharacterized membrane protein